MYDSFNEDYSPIICLDDVDLITFELDAPRVWTGIKKSQLSRKINFPLIFSWDTSFWKYIYKNLFFKKKKLPITELFYHPDT